MFRLNENWRSIQFQFRGTFTAVFLSNGDPIAVKNVNFVFVKNVFI